MIFVVALLSLSATTAPVRTQTFVLTHSVSGVRIILPHWGDNNLEGFCRERKLGIVRDEQGVTVDVWVSLGEGNQYDEEGYVHNGPWSETVVHFRSPVERDLAIAQFVRDAAMEDQTIERDCGNGIVRARLSELLDWHRRLPRVWCGGSVDVRHCGAEELKVRTVKR